MGHSGGTNNLDKAEREAANAEAIDKAHADIKAAEGQLKIFQPQFSEMTKGDSRKTFYEKQIKPYEEQIKSARQRLSELGYRTPAEQDAAMRAQMANHSGSG